MSNKSVKEELINLYGSRCMLTNKESKKLTYHHCTKKQHGGRATVGNGANLSSEAHQYLHKLEHTNIELYYLLNDALLSYKNCIDKNETELISMYIDEIVPKFIKEMKRGQV